MDCGAHVGRRLFEVDCKGKPMIVPAPKLPVRNFQDRKHATCMLQNIALQGGYVRAQRCRMGSHGEQAFEYAKNSYVRCPVQQCVFAHKTLGVCL